jgi:hypothetical protein
MTTDETAESDASFRKRLVAAAGDDTLTIVKVRKASGADLVAIGARYDIARLRPVTQCKNRGNVEVGHFGECLKCGAEQGIACRAPLSTDAKFDALRAALG